MKNLHVDTLLLTDGNQGNRINSAQKTSLINKEKQKQKNSRYLGSVMGLDELSSEEQESRLACSPLSKRATSPILKRISRPFNGLLDSRKVTPSKTMGALSTPASRRYSTTAAETGCGECGKKLTGKTVRLPDTQVRYHWKCLNCKGCSLPFEDTSFFIDSSNRVFHPEVSVLKFNFKKKKKLIEQLLVCTSCSYN